MQQHGKSCNSMGHHATEWVIMQQHGKTWNNMQQHEQHSTACMQQHKQA